VAITAVGAETGPGGDQSRDDDERKRDRQMIELLNELRIALPGVQILFAFLLTVPFAQGFQRTTSFQRNLFFVTLLATAVSTICFIAPTAMHRLRFHQGDRPYIIEAANKLLIGGLGFLAVAIIGAVVLITDFLFGGAVVWIYPAALALLLAGLWFVLPLLRRRADRSRRG
jgi:hypothetical protein